MKMFIIISLAVTAALSLKKANMWGSKVTRSGNFGPLQLAYPAKAISWALCASSSIIMLAFTIVSMF